MIKPRAKGIISVILLAVVSQWAVPETLSKKVWVDWKKGFITIDLRLGIDSSDPMRPNTRFLLEAGLEAALPGLFVDSILDIPYDSWSTLGQKVKEDAVLLNVLGRLGGRGEKTSVSFSRDMTEVEARYRFFLYGDNGLVSSFVGHERPFPMRTVLGFVPSRSFTGLVIYAKGEFPSHGKSGTEALQPALFPRIFDEDLNPVLELAMSDPASVKAWGLVAYTKSLDEAAYLGRIGVFPLRTMARGIFGRNGTDLIIPNDVSRKLLSREANRQLLREGRILIIID